MESARVETARVTKAGPASRLKYLSLFFSALMGALIFVSLLGHQYFHIEAMRVRLNIQPALAGYTVIEIPPLATIKAKTHSTPLQFSVRLEAIDLQQAQKMLEKNHSRTSLMNTVSGGLRAAAVLFTLKVLILSAAGGAFGVFLWRRKPGLYHLLGALAAVFSVGALLLGTYFTYDAGKFKNPEYHGALKVAPWIISLAGETLDKIDTLSNKMGVLAYNLHQLFNQIDQLQPFGDNREGSVKVLHVSDIHNNPAAMEYIQRIAELFKVDMIIDTGDITDYGTPLESLLLEKMAGIKVPYLFIPGNHESPETVKKMKAIPGVKVLDGVTVKVKNLRVMGVADPSSKVYSIDPPSLDLIPRYASEIEKSLLEQADQPDILALHNHRIAQLLAGKAPVILYGHDHKLSVEENKGSIMIDAGSAGAAGLRRLQGDKTPYSVVIQYYAPVEGKMKLLAADAITVKNLDSGFHVERHVFR
ncbi:MAG: metallophosphoesterase [Peptococcaceae bacterium]|nr:metallophosphoesterase [Peptococcaceae bacterium]